MYWSFGVGRGCGLDGVFFLVARVLIVSQFEFV